MKKRIILLSLVIAFAVPVFAQLDTIRCNKNEFSIGYGHFPASSLIAVKNQNHSLTLIP